MGTKNDRLKLEKGVWIKAFHNTKCCPKKPTESSGCQSSIACILLSDLLCHLFNPTNCHLCHCCLSHMLSPGPLGSAVSYWLHNETAECSESSVRKGFYSGRCLVIGW